MILATSICFLELKAHTKKKSYMQALQQTELWVLKKFFLFNKYLAYIYGNQLFSLKTIIAEHRSPFSINRRMADARQTLRSLIWKMSDGRIDLRMWLLVFQDDFWRNHCFWMSDLNLLSKLALAEIILSTTWKTWARSYKTLFMLNSTEQEICIPTNMQ